MMKLILFSVEVEVVEGSYSGERNNTLCDKVPSLAV